MAKVINPVEGSDAEEAAEQPIEKLEEEIKEMNEKQQPVQPEPAVVPPVQPAPVVPPAPIVEPSVEPIVVAIFEKPTTAEYALVGKLYDCIHFTDLLVKIENTGNEALLYKIMAGNSSDIADIVQPVKVLTMYAVEEFKIENLSWKYYGIFVKSFGSIATGVRLSAEPQQPY
jgi:hypothetical protein